MSRLGKTPIPLPKGVEITVSKGEVQVKGPKGMQTVQIPHGIDVKVEEGNATVLYDEKSKLPKPRHGLFRSLINNAVIGVSNGFEKQLSLIGVGYRAAVKGDVLDLSLGYSHPYQLKIPSDVTVAIEKSVLITISGMDKQSVGQFAANVRAVRPPEPYKGKGVRYVGEYVRKKAGKTAKGK